MCIERDDIGLSGDVGTATYLAVLFRATTDLLMWGCCVLGAMAACAFALAALDLPLVSPQLDGVIIAVCSIYTPIVVAFLWAVGGAWCSRLPGLNHCCVPMSMDHAFAEAENRESTLTLSFTSQVCEGLFQSLLLCGTRSWVFKKAHSSQLTCLGIWWCAFLAMLVWSTIAVWSRVQWGDAVMAGLKTRLLPNDPKRWGNASSELWLPGGVCQSSVVWSAESHEAALAASTSAATVDGWLSFGGAVREEGVMAYASEWRMPEGVGALPEYSWSQALGIVSAMVVIMPMGVIGGAISGGRIDTRYSDTTRREFLLGHLAMLGAGFAMFVTLASWVLWPTLLLESEAGTAQWNGRVQDGLVPNWAVLQACQTTAAMVGALMDGEHEPGEFGAAGSPEASKAFRALRLPNNDTAASTWLMVEGGPGDNPSMFGAGILLAYAPLGLTVACFAIFFFCIEEAKCRMRRASSWGIPLLIFLAAMSFPFMSPVVCLCLPILAVVFDMWGDEEPVIVLIGVPSAWAVIACIATPITKALGGIRDVSWEDATVTPAILILVLAAVPMMTIAVVAMDDDRHVPVVFTPAPAPPPALEEPPRLPMASPSDSGPDGTGGTPAPPTLPGPGWTAVQVGPTTSNPVADPKPVSGDLKLPASPGLPPAPAATPAPADTTVTPPVLPPPVTGPAVAPAAIPPPLDRIVSSKPQLE